MKWLVRRTLFASCVLVGSTALLTQPGHLVRSSPTAQASPSSATSALSAFVDVHAHLDPTDVEHSIQVTVHAMAGENAEKIVFMPPPFTAEDPSRYDADVILPALAGHGDKLATLGGGGTLNAMIHESVQSGDAGLEVQRRFKQRAESLLRAGAVGFGEMAAEHLPGATPYQSAPPDHPLFLLLADIAAAHGVPIDLHMEAVAENRSIPGPPGSPSKPIELRANIAAFERLLAHNPRARIIWAHAGWDNTGDRTPELCRRLLAAHRNLYMELKIDPTKPGRNSPLADGASGPIRPDWLQLFQDFPDHFVVGSDQHYPEPTASMQRWQTVVLLLNQLPADLRQRIAYDNAIRLYKPAPRR